MELIAAPRLRPILLFLCGITCACLTPREDREDPAPLYEGPTEITSLTWTCSASEDTWTIAVETTGWTSGALLSWSPDGRYVEEHDLRSTAAAADGSADSLNLELDIEADPGKFTRSSSTALLCDATTQEDLSGRMAVYDPVDGGLEADCWAWGEVDWTADFGYADCVLIEEDTGR